MAGIRAYILSVIASSVICGCVQLLVSKKNAFATLIKSLCGIYMAFVLIAPLQRIDFSMYGDYFAGFTDEAKAVVADGENIAQQKYAEIIKSQSQAYIYDKAVSLGANVAVEVKLSDDTPPIPCGITIKGAVSPYVKKVLADYIEDQLGIPKEAQMWMQSET